MHAPLFRRSRASRALTERVLKLLLAVLPREVLARHIGMLLDQWVLLEPFLAVARVGVRLEKLSRALGHVGKVFFFFFRSQVGV